MSKDFHTALLHFGVIRKMLSFVLTFITIFSLGAAQSSQVSRVCQDGFRVCFQALMESSSTHPSNVALLCRDTDNFEQCYRNSCPVSDADILRIRQDLARNGYQCGTNSSQATNAPGTATTPWALPNRNVSAPCLSAVDLCTKDYVTALLNKTENGQTDENSVCSMSYDFIKCVARSCNTDSVIKQIKDGFEAELWKKGVTCFLSMTGSNVSENASGSFTRTDQVVKITALIATLIVILKPYF
ncbi:hypothetical protein Bpfe_007400 [Biomphalaria pfeifferi]|uniref:Uncharacterized protein n=1 Tax=Biomphalaria pfeifferi TaxID=112525 RepID=A0AAD8C0J4_BIOPF|nr:hypothetical protein Bpfe_007400 [Biomphalaria pfeifferi]